MARFSRSLHETLWKKMEDSLSNSVVTRMAGLLEKGKKGRIGGGGGSRDGEGGSERR